MTDTPATPETEPAKQPDQPRPFQFTIRSLMILTAVVAVFLALVTQVPVGVLFALYTQFPRLIILQVAGVFGPVILFCVTLYVPRYWRGLTAINITVFTCITLQVLSWAQPATHRDEEFISLIVVAFCAMLFSIIPLSASGKFNKISGVICFVFNALLFGYQLYASMQIYVRE